MPDCPPRFRRKRGVVLTDSGRERLLSAKREAERLQNTCVRFTLEQLSERIGLGIQTIAKVLAAEQRVDLQTLDCFFRAFALRMGADDYSQSAPQNGNKEEPLRENGDWGEAVDGSGFCGRMEELSQLERWSITDRCRLIALLGVGGIGKTALAFKFARQVQPRFERVIWRSLRDCPPCENLLLQLVGVLSGDRQKNDSSSLSRLLDHLRATRCLLVFDNFEAVMCGGEYVGRYRDGYEGYGELLRRVGEEVHSGCVLITGREKPKEMGRLQGGAPVRSLHLSGLEEADGLQILSATGLNPDGPIRGHWTRLVRHYGGNPLILKMAATTILEVFDSNVEAFLKHKALVFGDIRDLLKQQFDRLTELEKELLYWLAVNREPVSFEELSADFVVPPTGPQLLEAIESLGRRSLIEKSARRFTLQPVVMEYVGEQLSEQVCAEIAGRAPVLLLNRHALMKAGSKDYLREAQVRLLVKPTLERLSALFEGRSGIEERLGELLTRLRADRARAGYAAGNLFNLLCYLGTDLGGYDFSGLAVWQADLRSANLRNTRFVRSELAKSVVAEALGSVNAVAFSPDGTRLAVGDANGGIFLYGVADGRQHLSCQGHTRRVWSVAFSPDGRTLASAGDDRTVKLWEVSSGVCRATLKGHSGRIHALAFHPDGSTVASGSDDRTLRVWEVSTGRCLKTLAGHDDWVRSVAFDPRGRLLASGGNDCRIVLWDSPSGERLNTLHGHSNWVATLAFSPDGTTLASGGYDRTVRLWDTAHAQCLRTLRGHSGGFWTVTVAPDGKTVAGGGNDHHIRLWEMDTGRSLRTLTGHSNWVLSTAFHPQDQTLVSSDADGTIRLWNALAGEGLAAFTGHTGRVWSVAFSGCDVRLLASAGADGTVRLWDVPTGQCLKVLEGHTSWVYSVVFAERAARLVLASGGDDGTVRLWDLPTGQCLKILEGHTHRVFNLACSPDGRTLASASADRTVRLWDLLTGHCLKTLAAHTNWVLSVAFSPDGRTLASGSYDQTLKLWDASTGECLKTFVGHTNRVRSVAFSPDGRTLVSGSEDETVKLWRVDTGECLRTCRGEGLYEGMDISGITGLTAAQKMTLKALGARDTSPLQNL